MTGLILSKDAARFAELARGQQADFTAYTAHNLAELEALNLTQNNDIQWLLAEPAPAAAVLPQLPNLRWLQSTWAGVEPLLALSRRDYTLTNIRGVFAPLMVEFILAHALAYERHVIAHHNAQQRRQWFNDGRSSTAGSLRGKTLLLLGIGSIGAGVARTMRHMGMRVLGIASQSRVVEDIEQVDTFAQLPEFLPQADYVINTLPNTAHTQDFINAAFFAQMKPTAVFINVGRGQAVIEDDLAQALRNGVIAHAILDVYRTEPLPADHVFWDTPHLVLTSHSSAPSFPQDIFNVFWDNYQRYTAGQTLHHIVDFTKGY